MATVATQSQYPASAAPLPGPRYDNGFFSVVGDSGSRDRFDRLRPTDYFVLAVCANAHLKVHTFLAMRRSANPITVNHRRAS